MKVFYIKELYNYFEKIKILHKLFNKLSFLNDLYRAKLRV